MDFLEKLYSNENFGLYLVIAIAVLVVLFFIVLFLGKKDEKKTKKLNEAKEKEKQLVENNATGPITITPIGEEVANKDKEDLQSVFVAPTENTNVANTESVPVNIVNKDEYVDNNPMAFKEVTNEFPVEVKEEPILEKENTQNVVLNENINNNVNTPEEIEDETKEFDFEALADAINKELESIKESTNVETHSALEPKEEKPVIEEKTFAFPAFETVEPDKIPEQVINKEEIKPEIKPVIEERPKMPNVFSSVYVNPQKEKEEVKPEVKPVKPAPFELPKKIDLPKKAEEVKEEVKEVPSFLDQITTESYQIDK